MSSYHGKGLWPRKVEKPAVANATGATTGTIQVTRPSGTLSSRVAFQASRVYAFESNHLERDGAETGRSGGRQQRNVDLFPWFLRVIKIEAEFGSDGG